MKTMRGLTKSEKKVYLQKWADMRTKAMNEAIKLYGPLTKETHSKILKYIQEEELKWKNE